MNLSDKLRNLCIYYEIEPENLVLRVFTKNKQFSLKGESIYDVLNLLNLSERNLCIKEISEELDLNIDYVEQIINLLIQNQLIELIPIKKKKPFKSNQFIDNIENYIYSKGYKNPEHELLQIINKKIGIIGNPQLCTILGSYLDNTFLVEVLNEDEIIQCEKDLYIVIEDHENVDLFRRLGKEFIENNINFLRVIIEPESIHIGPLFIANETACYNCFLNRILSNISDPNHFLKTNENFKSIYKITREYVDICLNIVKLEVINYFSINLPCNVVGNEYVMYFNDMETYLSPVLKVPNCEICYS